jgi:hypothetical protein
MSTLVARRAGQMQAKIDVVSKMSPTAAWTLNSCAEISNTRLFTYRVRATAHEDGNTHLL